MKPLDEPVAYSGGFPLRKVWETLFDIPLEEQE
jgi:hypothetical protein